MLKLKYQTITTEATNFKNFNDDIAKVILTDQKGKVKFSTDKIDYRKKEVFPYIKNCLKEEDEKLSIYDYEVTVKKKGYVKKKRKEKSASKKEPVDDRIKKNKFRAITYPVFLHCHLNKR